MLGRDLGLVIIEVKDWSLICTFHSAKLYLTYSGVAPEWIFDRLQRKLLELQPR